MSEPTITASAPAEQPSEQVITLPWSVGVDAVCEALETYTSWRHLSTDTARCAELAGISPATAARFERTLRAVEAPIEPATENSAAPDRPGPRAADPAPTQ